MVGTAVYQVGLASRIQAKNLSALKPGVQKRQPPAESGASRPAIKPWMWNSGMITSPTSLGPSPSVLITLNAEAHTLRWLSGTILGRDVVPEVCRINAMSSGWAGPPLTGAAASLAP